MRLGEKLRRRFEDALEEAGLEDVKVGQTCSFISDHQGGAVFSGRITDVQFNFGDVTIYITVEGREKPIELINETVIEEDLPDRRQWSYHDPDESKPKQTRWIPGQLTLHPPGK